LEKGLVIKSTGSWYLVKDQNDVIVECRIRGKFRTRGLRTTNPVAVGDKVSFILDEKTGKGVIQDIEQRKNYIIRKSINLSKEAHILAANVDLAILVITLVSPKTFTQFIDRFLATCEAYQVPGVLMFNKTDLYTDKELSEMQQLIGIYTKIGYRCIQASLLNKKGLMEISELLSNKITLLAGHSGVGKTTLINLLEPKLELKTTPISGYHDSGMHTTTFPEMHTLSNGGYVIDSPGIKGFGTIEMDKTEMAHFFPEMFAVLKDCQFYNCTHWHEPKCAVKAAVEQGEISQSRYKSYLSLLNDENDEKYRTTDFE
jgi:ribosome biogenesis GTPase / thiamine phosphate phosphatase